MPIVSMPIVSMPIVLRPIVAAGRVDPPSVCIG